MQNISEEEYDWLNKPKLIGAILDSYKELLTTGDVSWEAYQLLMKSHQIVKGDSLPSPPSSAVKQHTVVKQTIPVPKPVITAKVCACGYTIQGNFPTCFRCHKNKTSTPVKKQSDQVRILKNNNYGGQRGNYAPKTNNVNNAAIKSMVDTTNLCEIHFETIDGVCKSCESQNP
jgi:hypothetical protein